MISQTVSEKCQSFNTKSSALKYAGFFNVKHYITVSHNVKHFPLIINKSS